ncbi:MAG: endolytic transglycosylase MltG [Actinomycetota bacterium]|nr:endolytic transglycosylase MltG [Actinomycetota bacterium]
MSQLGLDMTTENTRKHRRHGVVPALLALLLVGGLGAAAFVVVRPALSGLVGTQVEDYPGPGSGKVLIKVTEGQSLTQIGRTLKDKQVVASVQAFTEAAAGEKGSTGIQPGTYELREEMAAADAVALLLDPAALVQSRVTVPEGLRLDETIAIVSKGTGIKVKEFRAALRRPGSIGLPSYARGNAEGFLFPATYDVAPDATAKDVLSMMVRRYRQAAKAAGVPSGGSDAYDAVVIASIVEGEARRPADFPKVSAVVHNRLRAERPLQMDSTVNYALRADKELVTHEDLGVASPYNTYKVSGLPPGPINSPGERALRAAVRPADGAWIYFVTTNPKTGETKFTASESEFFRFKAEYKRNRDG